MALESLLLAAALVTAVPQRLFISSHSLMDQPLPGHLQQVAASLGTPLQWQREYLEGSSIRARAARGQPNLAGFDTLVITEQHGLIGSLMWNDTVGELRRYHERFIVANPAGRTWFYEPWMSVDNAADPRRWIAYERAASPVWQCIVTRINTTLPAPQRIEPLPAGVALARLVERATQGAGLAGISGASVRETMQRLFADDVHLTALGSYYMALVVYASLADRSPQGAWAPDGVTAPAAASLQGAAWEAVQAERSARRPRTLAQCRDELQDGFIATYWAYVRDSQWKAQDAAPLRWWRWARLRALTQWRLRRDAPDHPFAP
jgi:hypothetical protein